MNNLLKHYFRTKVIAIEEEILPVSHDLRGASLVPQMVKNLPAMQETWDPSLCWEDSLQKGMATHSSILSWRIPLTEEPGRQQSMGPQRVGQDCATEHVT